jgi:hypothetical protein
MTDGGRTRCHVHHLPFQWNLSLLGLQSNCRRNEPYLRFLQA